MKGVKGHMKIKKWFFSFLLTMDGLYLVMPAVFIAIINLDH